MNSLTICSIMKEKGCTNPESPESIKLCLNCPLDICDLDTPQSMNKTMQRRYRAKVLWESGLSIEEIAIRLNRAVRTVRGWLR